MIGSTTTTNGGAAMTENLTDDERTLLNHIPDDGESVGNTALRRSLGWIDAKYWEVRDSLIDKNLVILGRGKGGSVRRKLDVLTPTEDAARPDAPIEADRQREAVEERLYKPIASVLEKTWSKDVRLDEFFIQITARGGRRETGGTWTRPDVVAVYVSNHQHIPGKFVEVVAFEVKTHENCDVTSVYEALAHLRAATRSYVLVVVREDELRNLEKLLDQMAVEAGRHGIGLIVASNEENYDTWDFQVEAVAHPTDLAKLDEFIEAQISDDNKKRLAKWIK
jgi:hypothetical protein